MRWLAPALLGGLGAAVINIYWSHRSRRRECGGLILFLDAEFCMAFNRCVSYYRQFTSGEVSYSSLFVLSDASVLSKFSSLVGRADLVLAAINLKSHFFQIERHAEAASQFIMEAKGVGTMEMGRLEFRAQEEQGAAVGFFLSSYDAIVRDLRLLIDVSLEITEGSVADDLRQMFEAAIEVKKVIDAGRVKVEATGRP